MKAVVQILEPGAKGAPKTPARSTQLAILEAMVHLVQIDGLAQSRANAGEAALYQPQTPLAAVHVGAAFGLKKGDWLFNPYAGTGNRGLELDAGRALIQVTDGSPGASRLVQANGVGWAAKLRGNPHVACVVFGESIANQDNFHVALNFAGVHKTQTLFICAVFGDYRDTAGQDIAARADAYGIEGVRVDGNDALAVQKVVADAAKRARKGLGATLVEAVCDNRTNGVDRLAKALGVSSETFLQDPGAASLAADAALAGRDQDGHLPPVFSRSGKGV